MIVALLCCDSRIVRTRAFVPKGVAPSLLPQQTILLSSLHVRRLPATFVASQTSSIGDADPLESLDALDALVPRSKITPLIKLKSNVQGATQVFFHLALFALAAAIPRSSLSMLGMAFVSSFLFNGLHETVHRSAFRSRFVNNAWAHIFGFLCLRPARHYFYYHWQHHKHTGNRDLDSELQPGSFLDLPIETPVGYLSYISGVPFWIDAVSSIVRHAMGRRHGELPGRLSAER